MVMHNKKKPMFATIKGLLIRCNIYTLQQKKRNSNGYFYHLITVYGPLLNEGY
jgi:hypothetical protein